MRRTFAVLIATLLTLGAAEAGVRALEDRLPRELPWGNVEAELKADRMTKLQRMGVRASVAFVGSSMMDVGMNPEAVDVGSAPDEIPFNAAIFGTDARTMAFYTRHVVVPRLRPRLVVIGASSFDLNDGGLTQWRSYNNIITSREAQRLRGERSTIERLGDAASERSALIRHRTSLRKPSDLVRDQFYRKNLEVSPFGTLNMAPTRPTKYSVSEFFKNLARKESYTDFSVGGPQLEALEETVAHLRSKGIGVVIVKMPLTDDAVALHPNGAADYERFKKLLRGVADRHSVQYIDVPTAADGRYGFYDPVHLNDEGSRYFTDALGRVVRRLLAKTASPTTTAPLVGEADDVDAPPAPAPSVDAPGAADAEVPDRPVAPVPPDEPPPPPIVIPAPGPDTLSPAGV